MRRGGLHRRNEVRTMEVRSVRTPQSARGRVFERRTRDGSILDGQPVKSRYRDRRPRRLFFGFAGFCDWAGFAAAGRRVPGFCPRAARAGRSLRAGAAALEAP